MDVDRKEFVSIINSAESCEHNLSVIFCSFLQRESYILHYLYLLYKVYLCTAYFKLTKKLESVLPVFYHSSYRNILRPFRYPYPWHYHFVDVASMSKEFLVRRYTFLFSTKSFLSSTAFNASHNLLRSSDFKHFVINIPGSYDTLIRTFDLIR